MDGEGVFGGVIHVNEEGIYGVTHMCHSHRRGGVYGSVTYVDGKGVYGGVTHIDGEGIYEGVTHMDGEGVYEELRNIEMVSFG